MNLQKAQKQRIKLRIGISSPSGFGMTYSPLLMAYGMTQDWSKIAVIDSENGSGSLYAALGEYNTLNLDAPYSPERFIQALKTCEKANISVAIIDSLSKEWIGKGGCLQIHEQLGGRFQDWAKVSPRHQALVDAILTSNCHVILTVRKKIDYSMDKDSNGRTKVVKLGLKDITREGLDFEMTTFFEIINDNHLVIASKDRTGLFTNKPEFVINVSTGKKLIQWCDQGSGSEEEKANLEIKACESIEELKQLYSKYSNIREVIKPLVIARKEMLENLEHQVIPNNQIIQQTKNQENGTDSNK